MKYSKRKLPGEGAFFRNCCFGCLLLLVQECPSENILQLRIGNLGVAGEREVLLLAGLELVVVRYRISGVEPVLGFAFGEESVMDRRDALVDARLVEHLVEVDLVRVGLAPADEVLNGGYGAGDDGVISLVQLFRPRIFLENVIDHIGT